MLNLKTSENHETKEIEDENKNEKEEEKDKNTDKNSKKEEKKEKSDKKLILNSSKKSQNLSNNTKISHKSLNNNISRMEKYDTEELKKRIKKLEEKADRLERKNIYYYNILKKNYNLNYVKEYNDPIEEYIDIKRNKNLNGFNQLMIDISNKIDDFIEDEKIRDREKLEYYQKVNELKDDISYRIKVMKILQEKERRRDIERRDINKNFYVINYNQKSGEIDPNSNNNMNNYEINENIRYGNPYNKKSFNNNRDMMPARMNKNGISMSNQYISVDNPEDYYKYQIYDRYKNDYKKHKKNNILKRTGSSYINSNEDFSDYKYHNGRKIRVSSSTDNIYDY